MLLDQATGSLHMLNDVGAAIWSRIDGSRTVGALIAELSQSFEADRDRVAHDVRQFLGQLAALGLLEGSTATGQAALLGTTTGGQSWSLDTVWVDWYTAQVLDAMRSRGVEAMLLKGPAIRRWLYHDAPGERGYLDADLLVPTGSLGAAAAVLTELGFEREVDRGATDLYPWAESWRRAADGAVVDLHRTLQGCEYAPTDPWPALRAAAVKEEVGGTQVLVPSLAARALQIVLVSPADRPWHRWDDLGRALERLSLDQWRETASLARALGVERKFGYRLSQAEAGPARAQEIGVPSPPGWWLRLEADPALRWVTSLAELPSWRARIRLARALLRPPRGYTAGAWAAHVLRMAPGAFATLMRRARRPDQSTSSLSRS